MPQILLSAGTWMNELCLASKHGAEDWQGEVVVEKM